MDYIISAGISIYHLFFSLSVTMITADHDSKITHCTVIHYADNNIPNIYGEIL